ncbi:MAG TPA: SRPBCC family protein [Nitrospirota bacterium]|nr:SRPBCC family protein [Nitrospirota bacterium]
MAHLKKNRLIYAPIEKVYAFARNPMNWATWYVGLSEPEKVTGGGEVGTSVEHSYLLAGIRFPVTTRVLEDSSGAEGCRWRGLIEGPLEGEQTWNYRPQSGGTEVTFEIQYTVPGKALGKFVDRLIIERMVEHNAELTMENLKMMCEKKTMAA